jgi:hypothetical protein
MPDVADLSGPDQVRQGTERVVQVGIRVKSVPSRRSEFSTSRMIQRRELPRRFGSSPIGMCTLLASTTSSRLPPARALPTMTSDSPAE